MNIRQIPHNLLKWRIRHIKTAHFNLILAAVTGALSGLAAVVLKDSVHALQQVLSYSPEHFLGKYIVYFYPMLGIVLTVLISKYILRDKLGHGVTDILYNISKKSSDIRKSKMWSRMITSAVTVGFGGSVGLEAPIVVTGSAIGSNFGKWMHMNYQSRTLLIGCGAAGAIAGIFNSPVAGVIFSSEVILAGIGFASFIPLLFAAVSGSLVSLALRGPDTLFTFTLQDSFMAADTPLYIVLGIVCGLVSVYFTKMTYAVERRLRKIGNPLVKAMTGGILVAVIIFVFPPIYGEGYETIKLMLESDQSQIIYQSFFSLNYGDPIMFVLFAVGIILFKPLASSLTIESGGSGGVFAPSLFLGGITGFLFAFAFNLAVPGADVSLSNFALVGMCGVMSGVLHAPLTAIFLIAEITSGYTLFVPLMLVSAISFISISYFEKYSIYTKQLIERGEYVPHDKDLQLLSNITVNHVIEQDLLTIREDQKLYDMIDLVRKSRRNIFPVLDASGQLKGIISLDDIRDIMFDEEARKEIHVSALMKDPPEIVSSEDNMQVVMDKFERCGAWNLPVIRNNKYVGFISKSRIFNAYRSKLMKDKVEI
jgi:CIC family chloride channel protein